MRCRVCHWLGQWDAGQTGYAGGGRKRLLWQDLTQPNNFFSGTAFEFEVVREADFCQKARWNGPFDDETWLFRSALAGASGTRHMISSLRRAAMSSSQPHRKLVRHFHEPGDVHELTFSCYRRRPLLTNNAWRTELSRSIDAACQSLGCFLAASVYMPEHVHLLVWGLHAKEEVSVLLSQVKQPVSIRVRQDLEASGSRLLTSLMVRERPGKVVFRYWQEGPGFDRNLYQPKTVQASIDYIHLNPVKRGLCVKARDWRWSSSRWYESDGQEVDEALPLITPLPAEFWLGG